MTEIDEAENDDGLVTPGEVEEEFLGGEYVVGTDVDGNSVEIRFDHEKTSEKLGDVRIRREKVQIPVDALEILGEPNVHLDSFGKFHYSKRNGVDYYGMYVEFYVEDELPEWWNIQSQINELAKKAREVAEMDEEELTKLEELGGEEEEDGGNSN